jgi:putative ABC transport system ATP-binding protein
MAEVVTKLASAEPKITRDECAVIALEGVSREYAGRTGVVRALDSATFSIVAGEWVAITGPSGSGKSTLVNMLGCLDRPTCGELKIDGVDVAAMTSGSSSSSST